MEIEGELIVEDEEPDLNNSVEPPQKGYRYMPPSSVGFSFFVRGDQLEFQVQYFAVRYEREGERNDKGQYISQSWKRIFLV